MIRLQKREFKGLDTVEEMALLYGSCATNRDLSKIIAQNLCEMGLIRKVTDKVNHNNGRPTGKRRFVEGWVLTQAGWLIQEERRKYGTPEQEPRDYVFSDQ